MSYLHFPFLHFFYDLKQAQFSFFQSIYPDVIVVQTSVEKDHWVD